MIEHYRGHRIELQRDALWSARLTEAGSGALLPTKATALPKEGPLVLMQRARRLVDLYIAGQEGPPDRRVH